MSIVLVKAYAAIHPVSDEFYCAMRGLLEDWHMGEALSRRGDMLLISHEGVYFPAEEVARTIREYLDGNSEGKLDYLDLENWRLHRYLVSEGQLSCLSASLDIALETCTRG